MYYFTICETKLWINMLSLISFLRKEANSPPCQVNSGTYTHRILIVPLFSCMNTHRKCTWLMTQIPQSSCCLCRIGCRQYSQYLRCSSRLRNGMMMATFCSASQSLGLKRPPGCTLGFSFFISSRFTGMLNSTRRGPTEDTNTNIRESDYRVKDQHNLFRWPQQRASPTGKKLRQSII